MVEGRQGISEIMEGNILYIRLRIWKFIQQPNGLITALPFEGFIPASF